MKTLFQLPAMAKVFTIGFLLLAVQQALMSQSAPRLIPGSPDGQPIVACNYQEGYRYVATSAAIYSGAGNENTGYFKVYTAPAGFHISGFANAQYYAANLRAVLLNDVNNNSYVALNQIRVPAADITGDSLVQLPQSPFNPIPFIKIGRSGNDLYALSQAIICGVQGYLYISHDWGHTWTQDTAGNGGSIVFDFAVDTNQNVFVLGPGYLYEKTGITITALSNSDGAETIFIDRQNRIALGAWNTIDVSLDGGATFNSSVSGGGYTSNRVLFADDAFGHLFNIGADNHVYSYSDADSSWINIDSNFNVIKDATIACFSGDQVLVVGTNMGLFASADFGVNWNATNQGIQAEDIYSLIAQPFGRLLCTTDLGVFYKDDADSTWHPTYPFGAQMGMLQLYNDKAGNIFATYPAPVYYGGYSIAAPLAKSTDNGLSWTLDTSGFGSIYAQSFYIDETGAQHYYNPLQYNSYAFDIWTRGLESPTWALDTIGLPEIHSSYGGISVIHDDGQSYLYADYDDLEINSHSYMYRRPLNGVQWVLDTAGLGLTPNVTCMASNPEFGIIAVTASPTGMGSLLYRRAESGWVPVPARTDSSNISSVSLDANGVIFVAEVSSSATQANAVYFSTDTGATWSPAYLTGMNIHGGLVSSGCTTYALTQGNWGYEFVNKGTTTGIPPVPPTPGNNIRVFPNPSSSGEWTVQTGTEWMSSQVEVSDVDGRIVYRTELNSTNTLISSPGLASGIYILNIHNAEKSTASWLVK